MSKNNIKINDELCPTDFVLFVPEEQQHQGQSHLKTFINALNFYKMKKPFKFSYISESGQLIPDLSLRENILLDCVDHSLQSNIKIKWNDVLTNHSNKEMINLMNHINDLDSNPNFAHQRCLKLAAIVKALLNKTDYIFLESPEKYLNALQLDNLVQALKFHSLNNESIIIIYSQRPSLWQNFTNKNLHFKANKKFEVSLQNIISINSNVPLRNETSLAPDQQYQGQDFIKINPTHNKKAA
jgi:ABC-type lipoprotein export system ATPase subunit